ncbi:MAG: polar amino acid transport system substrate-binding protein [Thermomicrobiales bacterium]|jgi:polar amino acid transport system substrate-binding protein|nr:polar amino acid transport system substrate-binding protein [Thermomicrobiales bacterium]MEA2524844.1 polar amino acid transport system substrate-binding protein [Thermomicrobiales bacterium]MEA2530124.1 polar amino acid transport system substrate-binding protein [Thermomicrobiales bacterium]MEA2595491.1 polar amino acid transport system substrate-binding protein [Thermomicrobiales bacterium]
MPDRFDSSMTSRRKLLGRGAALSGAAVAAAGLAPAAVLAQDGGGGLLQKVLDRGNVIVGTGSTNPPWHFEDENGNLVGMDIEMGRILANGLFDDATKVEFVSQAADARIPNLLSGKVDISIQFMSVTRDRSRLVEFTIPYYREAITLLLLKDSPYNTLADVQGKGIKVAILQNVYAEDLAHQGVPDAEVLQFDSVANTILALESGRADAAISDFSSAAWLTTQNPDKYKYPLESWGTHSYSAAIAPGDQRWLNFVNQIFHGAMTGLDFALYRDAFKKYFSVDVQLPAAGFPMEFA